MLAPQLIDAEVAQTLRGLVLGRKLTEADVLRALHAWRALAIDRRELTPLLPRVWELRANLTAHDAAFVAAAERHGVPLVTSDRKLAPSDSPAGLNWTELEWQPPRQNRCQAQYSLNDLTLVRVSHR